MDAAATSIPLPHNADLLKLDLSDVDSIVVSRGHPDHVGGMPRLLEIASAGRRVPLLAHPDAFLDRWLLMPGCDPQEVIHVKMSLPPRHRWQRLGPPWLRPKPNSLGLEPSRDRRTFEPPSSKSKGPGTLSGPFRS